MGHKKGKERGMGSVEWGGVGQFVVFNRVLRKVHLCVCIVVRGGGESANKEEVMWKQKPNTGTWFGLWHSFMTGKSGQTRSSLHSPDMYGTHILTLL